MKIWTMSPLANARPGTALIALTALLGSVFAALPQSARAQDAQWPLDSVQRHALRGRIRIPDSSLSRREDFGFRAHTHFLVYEPTDTTVSAAATVRADGLRPNAIASGPAGESPQSMRAAYGLPASGGSGVIAIIGAYDYATALNDFNVFSKQFGLPIETSTSATATTNQRFQVIYAGGVRPTTNGGWAQEAALDIEWAHAMAPNAKIVLVEAKTNSYTDLFAAITLANSIPNVHQVSMSWGGAEFSYESFYDRYFTQPGVVYVASSGDVGGAMQYPAASPNIVSAGGTTIHRDSAGNFLGETGWSGAGGGVSAYEARPAVQNALSTIVGSKRGVPDISLNADPNSGVAVYCSTVYGGRIGWLVFGGTSASAPALAGIINSAATARGSWANSSAVELGMIYGNMGNGAIFNDVVGGTAGSFTAVAGWDFVTGVGSSRGISGK